MVADATWCWSHPLLVTDFRYLRKKTPCCKYYVRPELRMRSKYGLAVSFQCITSFYVRRDFRDEAFHRLTSFWKRIEVLRGCYAELPPVLTYRVVDFRD